MNEDTRSLVLFNIYNGEVYHSVAYDCNISDIERSTIGNTLQKRLIAHNTMGDIIVDIPYDWRDLTQNQLKLNCCATLQWHLNNIFKNNTFKKV